jgi:carbamoyl-phosphate synthase large subunit
VSSPDLVEIARDKRKTATYFSKLGIRSPEVFTNSSPRFPVIAKPFDGSLSRDIHILRDENDYSDRIRAISNLMLAEYLDPAEYEEFTCDAYYDCNGSLRCVVPRLRLEVRGGEVSKALTVNNNIVDLFKATLSFLPGALGCLTFQFFRKRDSGELYLIELNARFGGGYPLSLAAGANYPAWLYAEWILGDTVPAFSNWDSNLTMLRYDDEVFLTAGSAHV